MEPMAHSPSPTWSLDGGPLPLPLLTPVLDPDDSTLTDSTLQTDFHIVGLAQQGVMDEIDESPSRMGPGGSTQRSPRPSAFTSLQAWDSDSEKEMLDEEELQHFSNPHGLAAHSPGPSLGSPTAGLLQESPEFDIDKSPKRIQHLDLERDFPSSCNEWDQGNIIRAQTDEPKTKRRTSAGSQSKKGTLKKSTGSLLSKAKPNQRRRKSVGIKEKPKGKEEVPLLDVYSFPGDSDAESSPPAHWAQCTYTQRRRKKRALLKPFSSQASQRSKPAGTKQPVVKARKGAGPKKASGAVAFRGQKKGDDAERMEQKVAAGSREKALCQEIFTCVECSIYFKKQVHLREHVQQHCQSCDQKTDKAKVRDGEMFACLECGWELEDGVSLSEHHRLHQESRDKILKEIRKLDKNTMEGDIDGSVKVRTKRRAQRRTPQQRPSSSQGVRTPKCDTCGFEASSQSALREHSCQISPSLTTELEGESFPGTSRDFCSHDQDSPSKSKLKTTAGMTTQDVPALPSAVPTSVQAEKSSGKAHRRDVAYKSIGNHRTWAREEGGRGPTSHLQLSKMESTENQDHVVDETEEEKASLHSDSSRITSWLKDESSPSMEAKFIHAGQEKLDDGDEEEVNDCDDDEIDEDADRFLTDEMLDDEPGSLRNVEKKCPYCPEQFHNGIGLANHVRGHLNRVGVSYNVRHFISPEEVNAIERKFSYQKKRKKANFDPDTFSLMRCEFCSAGFDTRAGLSSHARAHLRDFGITNWEVTVSPINVLRELFSSRPDLVPPTGPPLSSPGDEDFDLDEEAEEPDEAGGTGGGGALEGTGLSSSSSPPSHPVFEAALEEAEEFDEPTMEEATPSTKEDARLSKDSESMSAPPPRDEHDTKATPLLKCEVCFAPFETRRGLSSHARSHLRQLGISISESSGAPIDLLYQLIREREDSFSPTLTPSQTSSTKKTMASTSVGRKHVGTKQAASEVKHEPLSPPLGPSSSRSSSPLLVKSRSASPLLKKAPVSSLLPASSPLRYLDSRPSLGKSASASVASPSSGKPFWAPQETDAPLNLMETDSNDIVCQLCGAWFETRKGLSSHARAHLRHFGVVDAENKGSPIDYLYQLIRTDDFKHRIGTLLPEFPEERGLPSPSTKRLLSSSSVSGMHKARPGPKASASSLLLSPPVKRLKASERSILPVFRLSGGELTPLKHGEALKEIACEFCGEYFENRKGLSSHARSHLRQLGITEWSVNGSPIDTLRELIIRQGLPCALPVQMMKTPPPSPSLPLSPSASPSSSALGKRLPFSAHQLTAHKMGTTSIVSLPVKPEPVQVEVSSAEVAGEHEIIPVLESWSSHGNILPLNQVPSAAAEPTREIGCEFCGEYFENRKGLSSHARSHLRQLGITQWSVNGSPIDTLREVMRRRGVNMSLKVKKEPRPAGGSPVWDELGCTQPKYSRKAHLNRLHSGSRLLKQGMSKVLNGKGSGFWGNPALGKRLHQEETYLTEKASSKMFSNQPVDYSFKGKSPPDKYSASHSAADASCELCGFYFENRKALASHARAHLRQFGVTEWCVNGSPIETLSAWIRSKPHKVAEMHRRYLQGVRHFPKKQKNSSSFSLSADSRGALYPGSHKPLTSQRPSLGMPLSRRVGREVPGAVWGASRGRMPQDMSHQVLYHGQVARSELNVRTPRGYERRPPKHLPHSEGGDRDAGPPKPPRTGTIPALVPKPPSTPLVKLVGKIYSLQCRFCERTFHGPLSVQEDWIRHLQQHILNLNYSKPDPASADPPPTSPPPTAESQTEVKEALPPPEEESLPPPTLNAVPDPLTPTALTPDALTPDLPPEQVSAQDV